MPGPTRLPNLKKALAGILDEIHAAFPAHADPDISIVLSHKGRADDAIVIGDHDLPWLTEVVTYVATAECDVEDITTTEVVPVRETR